MQSQNFTVRLDGKKIASFSEGGHPLPLDRRAFLSLKCEHPQYATSVQTALRLTARRGTNPRQWWGYRADRDEATGYWHWHGILLPSDYYQELRQKEQQATKPTTPSFPSTAPSVPPGPNVTSYTDPVAQRVYAKRKQRLVNGPLRPKTLADIFGQDHPVFLMRSLLLTPSPPHLMLLGPPGVGKTTVAHAIFDEAKADINTPFMPDAPFVVVDGTRVLHDRNNNISALQSVVIESLYSGIKEKNAKYNLAPDTPEIRVGVCGQAHLGVLFIDEIGAVSHDTLMMLLKVLEEGFERLPQRAATGNWISDPRTPKWMKHFVMEGIPASFILIGATTRSIHEIDPALRSRCEVIQFNELTSDDRRDIARRAAETLGIEIAQTALDRIASTTSNGREASRRVMLAASAARRRNSAIIELQDVTCPAVSIRTGFRP